jgi:hypothetical protein
MLSLPAGQEELADLTKEAIRNGTAGLKDDLFRLYDAAWQRATPEERHYLPVIRDRIVNGSLAERMRERISRGDRIESIMADMAECLRTNTPYGTGSLTPP